MSFFEQYANEFEDEEEEEETFEEEESFEEEDEEEIEEELETEETTNVDGGQTSFMMNIPEDPNAVLERNRNNAKENKTKDTKKEDKTKNKKNDKKGKDKDSKVASKPFVKPKSKEEEMEESLSKFDKVIVKVFGRKEYEFTDKDEIKLLKLEELKDRLIVEKDYEEFSNGISWGMASTDNDKTAILVPTYKFHAKG